MTKISTRRFICILTLASLAGLALVPGQAVAAGCAGVCQASEILVGEDKDSCYCREAGAYRKCVVDARKRFNQKLGSCEGVVACLRRNDISDEAGLCAATALTIPLSAGIAAVGTTAVGCGWLTVEGLTKAKDCVNNSAACKADALNMIKADIEDCKSD